MQRIVPHPIDAIGSDLRELRTLARVFALRRRQMGLTQRQAASACGVSVQWLSEFENAKGDFGIVRIVRLAEALGLSLAVQERPVTDIDRVFDSLRQRREPGHER